MLHGKSRFIRLTRLAALATTILLAACSSSSGTGPGGLLAKVNAGATIAGTWVHQQSEAGPDVEPLISGGEIVADTLTLDAAGTGTWAITWIDPLDAGVRRRNLLPFEWSADEGKVHILFHCGPPTSLCDPLPGWDGTRSADGRLVLESAVRDAAPHARVYVRLEF